MKSYSRLKMTLGKGLYIGFWRFVVPGLGNLIALVIYC